MNKAEIYQTLHQLVLQKKDNINQLIQDLRASNTETKSSMGDKYETSREMLQQEVNRLQGQRKIMEEQIQILKHLKTDASQKVELGSLVETNAGFFYISVSYGKFKAESKTVFAISDQSPLAKAMMGHQKGGAFKLSNQEHTIKNIW